MSPRSLRRWCWIHKWTSLICTLFLLMLCITGLPLIFSHELEHAFSELDEPEVLPEGTPYAKFDRIVAAALERQPEKVVHLLFTEEEEPEMIYVGVGDTPEAPFTDDVGVYVDSRTARVLGEERFGEGKIMDWILILHIELFAGTPGKLFLGGMAFLFLLALISGVMIYAPFMRGRGFAVVRRDRGPRVKWLDLHNVLGMVVLVWMFVVGATGMLNAGADLLLKLWQREELSDMTAAYKGLPPVKKMRSLDAAIHVAAEAEPEMKFSFVAFPGTDFSSPHHYCIFMKGKTALTSRLIKPVLVDAETGVLTDKRDMPWYIVALLISQPLHFGDYGGMPLKVIWALLDLLTILILCSGLYLWWQRRKMPVQIEMRSGYAETQPVLQESVSGAPAVEVDEEAEADATGGSTESVEKKREVWRMPLFLAAMTGVGLSCALIGDGMWDGVSWLALSVPASVALWILFSHKFKSK